MIGRAPRSEIKDRVKIFKSSFYAANSKGSAYKAHAALSAHATEEKAKTTRVSKSKFSPACRGFVSDKSEADSEGRAC